MLKIDNNVVTVQLWDTAGQERFKSLIRNYYVNADGIILLYDVTNQSSFENVSRWMKDIYDNTQSKKIVIYLIGNKIDLEREIETKYAENKSKEYNIPYYESCARLNLNIREVMRRMILEIYNNQVEKLSATKLDEKRNRGKNCCL
jgi:small GTP-binding protein